MAERRFPSPKLRLVLALYGLLWWVLLPLILIYLRRRARREPTYSAHLGERFGRHATAMPGAVWVHAVSLGELRSAVPLIRALLAEGEQVVTTHFTPAGRGEAERVFADEIARGQLRAVWVPFEYGFAYRGFFRAFRPKYGLVMEIEIWPAMILAARRAGVALFMCNAQYPSKSMTRDRDRLPVRSELMSGFAGALVKSTLQRDRFAAVGVRNIAVTGELRFEQPVPQALVAAAGAARGWLAGKRQVITIASAVAGEDDTYLGAILALRAACAARGEDAPLIVYVPRAPERFDEVGGLIEAAGLTVARRSDLFDAALQPVGAAPDCDVVLGDSLGEMYFYLALAERVIVGGGFTPKGAHNIIEPLALKRPVIVGPEIWTIEYPAVEAIAAGVCLRVETAAELAEVLVTPPEIAAEAIDRFFEAHSGGVKRTLAAIPKLLAATSR